MTENEKKTPEEPQSEMPRFQTAALVLSGTGFALSLLLEKLHAKTYLAPDAEQFCSIGATLDCAAVAASPYSLFLGLPWALWGAVAYIALAIASYQRSRWLLPLSGAAAVISVLLFGVSALLIRSLCLFCEAVHLTSIALFIVAYRARSELRGDFSDYKSAAQIFSLPAGLTVALWVALPPYWSSFSWKAPPPFATGKTEAGYYWVGAENPEVTIHEYVNYKCPYCKVGSTRMLRQLGAYSSWRIVRHPQPLMTCPSDRESSCFAERMAYCAGEQGKFWQADRWLFAHVDFDKRFDPTEMVSDLTLDPSAFETCFRGPGSFELNDRAFKEARKKHIINVPSYEIDAPGGVPEVLKPLEKKKEKSHRRMTLDQMAGKKK